MMKSDEYLDCNSSKSLLGIGTLTVLNGRTKCNILQFIKIPIRDWNPADVQTAVDNTNCNSSKSLLGIGTSMSEDVMNFFNIAIHQNPY